MNQVDKGLKRVFINKNKSNCCESKLNFNRNIVLLTESLDWIKKK